MSPPVEQFLKQSQSRIASVLDIQLGSFQSPYSSDSERYLSRLKQAMHYSLMNGGKRVRPSLVYAAATAINVALKPEANAEAISQCVNDLDKVACAVEMIHAYSLIHDDLPAMDDDDLRRGQPTCHRAFDEATAILAGDALQARAFGLLTELNDCSAQRQVQLISRLSTASGQLGMAGGQAIDLAATDQTIALDQLETIHRLKTGALIRAAVVMGAIVAEANDSQLRALDQYGEAIGLAFQVQDDILDIEADTQTLGKTQGADVALNKSTYPSLLGLNGAKDKAQQLHQQAIECLQPFSDSANLLRDLSLFIISRSH